MTDAVKPKIIRVSRDQVSAARALVRLRGGVDKVDPVIAKIAAAVPRSANARAPRRPEPLNAEPGAGQPCQGRMTIQEVR